MKNEAKDEQNEDGDGDTGAGHRGKSSKMTDGACVAEGDAVQLRDDSQQLTQELTQKSERPSRRGGAGPGTKTYDNPQSLLHMDEDEEFEYAEDDAGVMAVARTPSAL